MTDSQDSKQEASRRSRRFFEDLWREGDPWRLETSPFERAKYEAQLRLLEDTRARRALEIGCGAGVFTRMLAASADRVLAVDIAGPAIDRARDQGSDLANVTFEIADVMAWDPPDPGAWDLVVMSETVYYLGWLHSFFDVYWLAHRIFEAMAGGGRFLMANTCGGVEDYLLRRPLVRTYHDLFTNVGFTLEREHLHQGEKSGAQIEALLSLYRKPTS